jgi:SHS family lactate transporter-like MFS transporter
VGLFFFAPHFTMADEKYSAEQREYVPASHEKISAGRYAATRITTLKPAMAKVQNPIALLRLLNLQQWMFFLVAFIAWTWDAFDFFTVSLTVEDLAETFHKTKKGDPHAPKYLRHMLMTA